MEPPTKPQPPRRTEPMDSESLHSDTPALTHGRATGAAGGYHHDYLSTIQNGPVLGEIVQSATGEPLVFNTATEISPCWLCGETDQPETLFSPCNCPGMVHRHCFRKWRQGWINPSNYFSCPRCRCNYNIERIKEATTLSKEEIKRGYRAQLLKLWLGIILFFGLVVFGIAGIAYLSDTGHKNIPVATKYLMSSIVNGFPSGNTTQVWEHNFKDPHVRVWPYYTLFAVFITSVVVLVTFAILGSSFSKEDHSGRTCCSDCDYCCSNSNDLCCCYIIYCDDADCNCCRGTHRSRHGNYGSSGGCSNCDCNGCDCNGCGDCKDCECKGGGGGGGEAMLVILVIVIIAVIVSAVFVIIFFTIQRSALLYDRYSAMIYNQQEELEGETIVLGKNETWRPLNEV